MANYEMKENEKIYGFTFYYRQKDVFVKTDYKNKTKSLAAKILAEMSLPANPEQCNALLYRLQKATCELKSTSNGRKYYDICGDGFGCSDPEDSGKTIVFTI